MIKMIYIALYLLLIFTPFGREWMKFLPMEKIPAEQVPLINYLFLGFLGIIIFRKSYKESFRKIRKSDKNFILRLLSVYILSLIAGIVLTMLFNVRTSQNQDLVFSVFKQAPLLLSFAALGLGGPITEECIYRECIIGSGGKRFGKGLMAIISILLFSWVHVRNSGLKEIFVYLPMAAGFVYLYLKDEGGLFASTAGHVLRNILAAALMLLLI